MLASIVQDVKQRLRLGASQDSFVPQAETDVGKATPTASPSSFDRLPNELLAEIFMFCLRDPEISKPHRNYAPLLPRSVCKRWREVVSRCPELWTRIAVTVTEYNISMTPDHFSEWLSHSGACPLDISISIYPTEYGVLGSRYPTFRQAAEIMGRLFDDAPRIRQLLLDIPHTLIPEIPNLNTLSFPLLERLDLSVAKINRSASDSPKPNLHHILLHAPELKVLKWCGSGSLNLPELVGPFGRLTALDFSIVETMSLSDCLDILQACPIVATCKFDRVTDLGRPIDPHTAHPLLHSRLRSLTVNGPVEPRPLLAVLTTPALRILELTYRSERTDRPSLADAIPDFIRRSGCSLEEFTAENACIQEAEIYQILQLCSETLIKLNIWDACESALLPLTPLLEQETIGSCMSNRVLRALAFPSDEGSIINDESRDGEAPSSPLCPKLQVLIYRGVVAADDGSFANVVESRWKSPLVEDGTVARLKRVLLESRSDRPLDTSRLRQLRAAGLDCRVFGY
ncbi:hypothetical protein ONZ45_g5922 [Pleurotus djamor]|nr:hypothetical protein ONZ45_g5922 [Pleurotus djamor]